MEATKHDPHDPADEQQTLQQQFAPGQTETAIVSGDLSKDIEATVEKEPGDRVRVTWVHGSNYRCNWWAPAGTAHYDNPGMYGLILTTHRVRKSSFLSVKRTRDGLVIQDRTRRG